MFFKKRLYGGHYQPDKIDASYLRQKMLHVNINSPFQNDIIILE